VAGVDIVTTERATPPFHAEQLESVGLTPSSCRIIVAKGAVAWRSAYGDVAHMVIEVDTPGSRPRIKRTATPSTPNDKASSGSRPKRDTNSSPSMSSCTLAGVIPIRGRSSSG
jgi:microcystin degradation protein MlrC